MQKSTQPRCPSAEERQELIDVLEAALHYDILDNADIDDLSVGEYVEAASIAVFDNFVSTEVDYNGKVMMVVWSLGPTCYEAFGWVNGQLEPLAQDTRFAA